MKLPLVSVIVPTYRDWDRLRLCLSALEGQTYPRDRFEVIVVNNDPEDSCPFAELPDRFQCITEERPGSYAARNAGLALARGEVLAFTDSDCIPAATWLEKAVGYLGQQPTLSRVGGAIDLFFSGAKLTMAELFEKAFAFPQEKYVSEGGAATANMLAKRAVFDAVGPFDAGLMSGEDMFWGKRAQAAGFPIGFCREAVVMHPARRTVAEMTRKMKRTMKGRVRAERGASIQRSWPRMAISVGYWTVLNTARQIRIILRCKNQLTSAEKMKVIVVRTHLNLVAAAEQMRLHRELRLGRV